VQVVGYLVDGWDVLEAMNKAAAGAGVGGLGFGSKRGSAGSGRFPPGEDWRVGACGQLSDAAVASLIDSRATGSDKVLGTAREREELARLVAAVASAAEDSDGKGGRK